MTEKGNRVNSLVEGIGRVLPAQCVGYGLDDQGFIPGTESFLFITASNQFWDPHNHLLKRYRRIFPWR